jgi:hypothetical protein
MYVYYSNKISLSLFYFLLRLDSSIIFFYSFRNKLFLEVPPYTDAIPSPFIFRFSPIFQKLCVGICDPARVAFTRDTAHLAHAGDPEGLEVVGRDGRREGGRKKEGREGRRE